MKSGRRWTVLATLIAGTVFGMAYWWRAGRPSANQFVRSVRTALEGGRLAEARRFAQEAVLRYPQSAAVRVTAAEVELEDGRIEEALVHLNQVQDDGSSLSLDAIGSAGDLLFQLNRLSDAESCFRRVLARNPQNVMGQQRLALLLALSGRRSAAQQFFFQIVRGGRFDTRDLALLGEPEQVFDNPEFVKRYEDSPPADPAAALGHARYALYRNKSATAAALYRNLIARNPADLDVLAGYGHALLEMGAVEELTRWHSALPASAEESAEIWNIRGRFAQTRSEADAAIRCYGEAVLRDPNQIPANYQLALLLRQRGDDENAFAFQQRAERLRNLKETLVLILADGSRVEQLLKAAELTEALGRLWEARGWYLAAAELDRRRELHDRADRLTGLVDDQTPQTLAAANPAGRIDLSRFSRPDWNVKATRGAAATSVDSRWADRVTFADLASQAGVNFTYFNGDDPAVQGRRIFESSGGGVASLDYDGDLWPDLYFTQACEWPPEPGQTRHLDRLYRNQGNGRFADVTGVSGLGDERYSQGVSAGDVNDDGFPDLYVANIGENRLYLNNGDGSFTDRTVASGLTGGGWTTSALVADLNGDGFPEIYDVTYVAGRLPFEHLCHDKQHKDLVRVCAPAVFPAEQDRLFLNRGDGTFENVSSPSGIAVPEGKGLGIVAFDLDGSGRLSLFVANDTTPNFLFRNQTAHPGDLPTFDEQAQLSGCAVNAEGSATASMGIALDDADGDGRLDLFVTTFHGEYDVLYLQLSGGSFADASGQARLKEPTVAMLGFGAQFLDGDLDGRPDLVVANGHVDDSHELGIPFRMRGQYFANRGHGQFVELPPAQLGDYFRDEQLGRGMARLDWNRDGREDFAVSNLDSPASLVTNLSSETGHFLALQLRGVQSSRDAIGATVVARVAGRSLVKQLTAGDGYQASNQRQLVFGLADDESVDELQIRWPSGREQRFQQVSGDCEYLLVEARPNLVRLPAPRGP